MKYRLPILICVLLLTAIGIFWIHPRMDSVKPSDIKPDCNRVKQCLRAEVAWPPGMAYCPSTLAQWTVRSRSRDGKWGYSMSECTRDTIISPRFDVAEKFGNNGLAKVSRDGKWGYVNLKGEETIELIFEEVGDFDYGLVPVRVNDKWGYSNSQGQIAVRPRFDKVSGVWGDKHDRSAVQLQGKWGYVNPDGDTVIELRFDRATEFRKGLAKVEMNRRWGLINKAGETVIAPTFDAIFDADSSTTNAHLFLVVLNQRYGYFDNEGREIIPPRLAKPVKARYNSGGIQISLNTAVLVPADDAAASTTPDVPIHDRWYFLDSSNEKLRFDKNGKAQFWRKGEWFYIDSKGMLLK